MSLIAVTHLTSYPPPPQAALSSQLSRLCAPVTAVGRLRGFIRSPGLLSTHRAFARSLATHLEGLDAELVALEAELQKQGEQWLERAAGGCRVSVRLEELWYILAH